MERDTVHALEFSLSLRSADDTCFPVESENADLQSCNITHPYGYLLHMCWLTFVITHLLL
jgi:hypothetical protein